MVKDFTDLQKLAWLSLRNSDKKSKDFELMLKFILGEHIGIMEGNNQELIKKFDKDSLAFQKKYLSTKIDIQ